MGYACPVCAVDQADAVHLANHLAVTASLGREDHLEWLETHAPEWGDCGPAELAEIVGERAPEIDTPDFETGHGSAPSLEEELARQTSGAGRGELTGESRRVLEEARELTRRMYEGDDDGSGGSADGDEGDDNATEDADETATTDVDETAITDAAKDANENA